MIVIDYFLKCCTLYFANEIESSHGSHYSWTEILETSGILEFSFRQGPGKLLENSLVRLLLEKSCNFNCTTTARMISEKPAHFQRHNSTAAVILLQTRGNSLQAPKAMGACPSSPSIKLYFRSSRFFFRKTSTLYKYKMQSSQVDISPKVRIGNWRAVTFLGVGGLGACIGRKLRKN